MTAVLRARSNGRFIGVFGMEFHRTNQGSIFFGGSFKYKINKLIPAPDYRVS